MRSVAVCAQLAAVAWPWRVPSESNQGTHLPAVAASVQSVTTLPTTVLMPCLAKPAATSAMRTVPVYGLQLASASWLVERESITEM